LGLTALVGSLHGDIEDAADASKKHEDRFLDLFNN
jgi:hypothetical protein